MKSDAPTDTSQVMIRVKRDVIIQKIDHAIIARNQKIQKLLASSISITHTDLPALRTEVQKLKRMHDAITLGDRYAWVNDDAIELILKKV